MFIGSFSPSDDVMICLFLVATMFPSLAMLVATRPGGRYWRFPPLWPIPSLLAFYAYAWFGFGIATSKITGAASVLLFVSAFTCALGTCVAAVHVIVRFVRFVENPRRDVGAMNVFYAVVSWIAAATLTASAVVLGALWWTYLFCAVSLAAFLVAIGVIALRLPKRGRAGWWPRTAGARAAWIVGVVVCAFSPVVVMFVASGSHLALFVAAMALVFVVLGERSAKRRVVFPSPFPTD